MSPSRPPAVHRILEEQFFSREDTFARRIQELEALLDFSLQFNHSAAAPLTRRWEYSLWPDGSLKEISPLCELYTGYGREDFIAHPDLLFSIVLPEDRERFSNHLQAVQASPRSERLGYKILSRSGKIVDIFQESLPTRAKSGGSAHKTIIAQLPAPVNPEVPQPLSTDKAWQYLVENNPDLIIMIDREGRFLYTNRPQMIKGKDDTLWKNIQITVVPEHREMIRTTIAKVFENGIPASYEIASPNSAGEIDWFMTQLGPVSEQGVVIAVIMMIRKITQLKHTEQQLSRWNEELEERVEMRTHQLQESNERLRVISELIPDYVYSARLASDGARVLEWSSGAFEQITGYSLEEINQQNGWNNLIHPADRSLVAGLSEDLKALQPTVLEYRILTKSGEVRWIQDHNKPVMPLSADQDLHIWGAVQDITDRKLAEDTLQRYAQRLESSVKLSADLRQASDRTHALGILVSESTQALNAEIGGIYLEEKNGLRFASGCGLITPAPETLPLDENHLLYQVMRRGEVRLVNEIAPAELGCDFCEFLEKEGVHTLALAPLRTSRSSIGVLYIGFRERIPLSLSDRQALDSFAEMGGNTLHRFQAMQQLEHNISQREHELAVLHEVMSVANQTSDLHEMVDHALQIVLNAVGCQIGVIMLNDPKDGQQKVLGHIGWTGDLCDRVTHSDLKERIGDAFDRQKVVLAATQILGENGQPQEIAFLGAEIMSKGVKLGRLGIYGPPDHLADPYLTDLISSITDQLAMAVESARLRKQAEETAILEERQRLARDLHDSVSQSLYGLVISADVGSKLLRLKEYTNLRETLENIESGALQALKEMRLMLFELRPLSLESEGLIKALNLRLNIVERRAGITPRLVVEGLDELSPQLELEMYRIATEALNNALKHASATSVQITIQGEPNQVRLEVADNGAGFDPTQVNSGGLGLASMKERARRISGELQIESAPAQGTRVILTVALKEPA